MICAIHQPQYLPYLGYFEKIARCDVFVVLDDVQYKKNEWQNRNQIKTPQGMAFVTVPVGYRFPQKINEVPIIYTQQWVHKHLRAFSENYQRAEFFEMHSAEIERILKQQWENLAALNTALVAYFSKALGLKAKLVLSSSLEVAGKSTERLVNICKAIGADTYLSGIGGKNYVDQAQFQKHKIGLEFQDFVHPKYPQVRFKSNPEFVSNLSIVDLVFNCGPKSLNFLMDMAA